MTCATSTSTSGALKLWHWSIGASTSAINTVWNLEICTCHTSLPKKTLANQEILLKFWLTVFVNQSTKPNQSTSIIIMARLTKSCSVSDFCAEDKFQHAAAAWNRCRRESWGYEPQNDPKKVRLHFLLCKIAIWPLKCLNHLGPLRVFCAPKGRLGNPRIRVHHLHSPPKRLLPFPKVWFVIQLKKPFKKCLALGYQEVCMAQSHGRFSHERMGNLPLSIRRKWDATTEAGEDFDTKTQELYTFRISS